MNVVAFRTIRVWSAKIPTSGATSLNRDRARRIVQAWSRAKGGNALGLSVPLGPGQDQQLYEYPRRGYSSMV